MAEQEKADRIGWLVAILNDPDAPRFYSIETLEEMQLELNELKRDTHES